MPVKVIIADDHPIVRQGLRRLLEAEPNFQVVAECSDGLETMQALDRQRPDVLIADLMMPGITGLEVARQVHQRSPQTKVIILSMHRDDAYVIQALRNGAVGYILKDTGPRELIQAVQKVLGCERYLSEMLSSRLIDSLILRTDSKVEDEYETLTAREREVLQLTAEGLSSPEVGVRLSISARTVEVHRANVMQKLGFKSYTDLIRYAFKRGLLPLDG